jgi:hypothetical protein
MAMGTGAALGLDATALGPFFFVQPPCFETTYGTREKSEGARLLAL